MSRRATHALLDVSNRRATHVLLDVSNCRAAHALLDVSSQRADQSPIYISTHDVVMIQLVMKDCCRIFPLYLINHVTPRQELDTHLCRAHGKLMSSIQ